jgi:hypothetical protein
MEIAFNKIDIKPIFIVDYYLCQFSVKHILCKCSSVCWSSTNTYRYRRFVGPPTKKKIMIKLVTWRQTTITQWLVVLEYEDKIDIKCLQVLDMDLLCSSNFWFAVKNFLMNCGSIRTFEWKGDNSWNIRELHW